MEFPEIRKSLFLYGTIKSNTNNMITSKIYNGGDDPIKGGDYPIKNKGGDSPIKGGDDPIK